MSKKFRDYGDMEDYCDEKDSPKRKKSGKPREAKEVPPLDEWWDKIDYKSEEY